LFGEELARRFAVEAQAPTVLVNVSNIGWFGRTVAVAQHLNISRLRSLELQRPMVRATNTGATAVIDHRGAVTARLPPHTRGVLAARVEGRDGLTPFARWASALGLAPLWALALGVPATLAWAGRVTARGTAKAPGR
jgi:apolipoprotein N-acyltransferase